ncbi:uncharacterized protein [Amphiura filiformis]|uniref:uncharacterized protein n=1 Tax=Amphiura filiformis TaxID=82378 RepID=UPI003B214676
MRVLLALALTFSFAGLCIKETSSQGHNIGFSGGAGDIGFSGGAGDLGFSGGAGAIAGKTTDAPPDEGVTVATTPEPERSLGMGYLIVVPKRLVADTEEVICITLTNMTQPITVYIQLLDGNDTIAEIAPYFMEFRYRMFNSKCSIRVITKFHSNSKTTSPDAERGHSTRRWV